VALRILISPLDWGLGHATRCIPIIRYLLAKKVEVIIASDGHQLLLLQEEFPQLEYIRLKGYRVKYSAFLPVSMAVALQVPKINSAIARENRELKLILEANKIDAVISDNRYGLYSEKVPSVIITHQLNIQSRFAKGKLREKTIAHLKKFNECWIPDYEDGDYLSAALSHPVPDGIMAKYIGLLSRFSAQEEHKAMQRDLLVVLSGPEPQRTVLEKKLIRQIEEVGNIKALIVRGIPGGKGLKINHNIEMVPHLDKNALLDKILTSKVILARPGYSTLMDLAAIGGKRAIFIPTPGQTEQEYLAMFLESENIAVSCSQKRFSLAEAWRKVFQAKGFNHRLYKPMYTDIIDKWLESIRS
jgi:uncharacterized protein (TIGR00661 family)